MDECIHLLDPATCTICNGKDRARRLAAQSVKFAFGAKFVGPCPTCGESVVPGDVLFRMVDESLRCDSCKVRA